MSFDHYHRIINAEICPYCGTTPKLTDTKEIYGRSYGMAYWCPPCDAYVGCHRDTTVSLGRLADKTLRQYKKKTHQVFDKIWRGRRTTRSRAYRLLSEALNTPAQYCHIGMFNTTQCIQAITFATKVLKERQP